MVPTSTGSEGEAYENFTTKDGQKMHKVVVAENGKIVSVREGKGHVDMTKILNDLKKKYGF